MTNIPHVTPEVEASYHNLITIAADTVAKLRKPDVFRVVENAYYAFKGAKVFSAWLAEQRPDLAQEVADCLAEVEAND